MLSSIKAGFERHALPIFAVTVLGVSLLGSTTSLNQANADIEHLRSDIVAYEQSNSALRYAGEQLELYQDANAQLRYQLEQLQRSYDDKCARYDDLRQYLIDGGLWSQSDLMEVVDMVIAESGNQSIRGQMAVAQCILDRYNAQYGGDTIHEILTAHGQFTTPYDGDRDLYPQAYEAVMRVFIFGERVYDKPVIYFYNPELANEQALAVFESSYEYLGTIDDHVYRSW